MKIIFQTMAALALLSLLNACASRPEALLPQSGRPVDLTLQASTTDRRYTYFELKPDGQLSFGGGQLAKQKFAKPVMSITPAQMQEVWNIIERFGLHQAHAKPTSAKARHVRYQLSIKPAGMKRRSYRGHDEEVPGIGVLHETLFNLQAAARYHLPSLPTGKR